MEISIFFWPVVGGASIGLAATLLERGVGRVAGVSGIVRGLLVKDEDSAWRWAFIGGMLLVALGARALAPHTLPVGSLPTLSGAVVAGALVGLGAGLSNGCTSGHGICGLSRGAWRSIAATATFMLCGVATVYLRRLMQQGAP